MRRHRRGARYSSDEGVETEGKRRVVGGSKHGESGSHDSDTPVKRKRRSVDYSTASSSVDSESDARNNDDGPLWRDELFVALKRGDVAGVRQLLHRHGNPINDPFFATGSPDAGMTIRGAATCLHVAAWAGQAALCKWLIRHGADVAARDGMHMTPAETATSAEVCRVLSRHAKYRRKFRRAAASVTLDQRLEAVEYAVRCLQLGERAPGPLVVHKQEPINTNDFEERLRELRRVVSEYNQATNQRVDVVEDDLANLRRMFKTFNRGDDRLLRMVRDLQADVDRQRITLSSLRVEHSTTRCCVWGLCAWVWVVIIVVSIVVGLHYGGVLTL